MNSDQDKSYSLAGKRIQVSPHFIGICLPFSYAEFYSNSH
jgi:hypothetical protein